MRLAFSTLGCPSWGITDIIANAVRNGYSGVEVRGLKEHIDLRQSPDFAPSARASLVRRFADVNVNICCLSASASFANATMKDVSIDEARAFIEIAGDLNCPMVRVFGGSPSATESDADATRNVVEALSELAPFAAEHNVTVVLETHDAFSTGERVAEVMGQVDSRYVAALWDLHHPYRQGEQAAETYQHLAPWLRHTHVKDSDANGYCLLGDGDVPIKEMVNLLLENEPARTSCGLPESYLCLEWEKRWHTALAEPEIVFPQYAKKLREYMGVAK